MVRALSLLFLLFATLASAEIYRWVDKDGVVHFSDRPQPDAETVEVQPPSVLQAPSSRPRSTVSADDDGDADIGEGYRVIRITSPSADQTFHQGSPTITATVELEPALQTRAGHLLRILVDGKPISPPAAVTSLPLPAPARGSHSIVAEVVKGEQRVAASPAVTIHMQQPNNNTSGPRAGQAPGVGRAPGGPVGSPPPSPVLGQ